PAWGCKATLSILSADGTSILIPPIAARWTSTPEPLTRFLHGDQLVPVVDFEKVLAGRRIDIFSHEDQLMPIVIKHEGHSECYVFTNESYYHPPLNANPDWQLGLGKHRLRVTVHYERGNDSFDFCIHNFGSGKD